MNIVELIKEIERLENDLQSFGKAGMTIYEFNTALALSEARRSLINQLLNERKIA